MIVGDNQFCARLLEAFLVRQGFNTRVFTKPVAALNWYSIHHQKVALVFLDIHMPQLSGTECFQDIIVINPNAKVAFISGEKDPCLWADLTARENATAFFSKPLNYHDVADWAQETFLAACPQSASQ